MSLRNELRDVFAGDVLGGANEHHCIDNGGCVICAGNRNADRLVVWLSERDRKVRDATLDEAAGVAFKRPGGYDTGIDLLALKQDPVDAELGKTE